jgi:hypothetical protein
MAHFEILIEHLYSREVDWKPLVKFYPDQQIVVLNDRMREKTLSLSSEITKDIAGKLPNGDLTWLRSSLIACGAACQIRFIEDKITEFVPEGKKWDKYHSAVRRRISSHMRSEQSVEFNVIDSIDNHEPIGLEISLKTNITVDPDKLPGYGNLGIITPDGVMTIGGQIVPHNKNIDKKRRNDITAQPK